MSVVRQDAVLNMPANTAQQAVGEIILPKIALEMSEIARTFLILDRAQSSDQTLYEACQLRP